MARVNTYLNFAGDAEEALGVYAAAFGTELAAPVLRMGDMSGDLPESERSLVGHAELPILAGHAIMATDMLASQGHELRVGNNVTVNLELDGRPEADRLYAALSQGGSESTGMSEMPWGYWGVCLDRFGIRWMLNCPPGV